MKALIEMEVEGAKKRGANQWRKKEKVSKVEVKEAPQQKHPL